MKRKSMILLGLLFISSFLAADISEIPKSYLNFGMYQNYCPPHSGGDCNSIDLYGLYPEADYQNNPVYILDFPGLTLFSYFNFTNYDAMPLTVTENTLGYSGPGMIGGTRTEQSIVTRNTDSLTLFIPFDHSVFGVGGVFHYDHNLQISHDVNFDVSSENDYMRTDNEMYFGRFDLYYAVDLDKFSLGVNTLGIIIYDPYGLEILTNDSGSSIQNFANIESSSSFHMWGGLNLGARLELDTIQIALAGAFFYGHTDWVEYVILPDNSVITRQENDQKLNENASSGTYQDQLFASVSPSLFITFTDNFKLIIDGSIEFLNNVENHNFNRYNIDDKNEVLWGSNDEYFDLTAGLEVFPHKSFRFRVGVGADLGLTDNYIEYINADGSSATASENTNGYDEVNFSSEPNNEIVKATFSSKQETIGVQGLLGIEWMPASNVVFFNSMVARYSFENHHYYLFNLADNSIWQEDQLNVDSFIDLSLNLGAGVQITDDLYLGLSADLSPVQIYSNNKEDALPVKNGTLSSGGEGAYTSRVTEQSNDFTIELSFVLGL